MTGHSKHACQRAGSSGRVCYLVKGHPGRVHVDVTDGGLVVWSLPDGEGFRNVALNGGDPLRDAPAQLRRMRCHVPHPSGGSSCQMPAEHTGRHANGAGFWSDRDAFRAVEPQQSCDDPSTADDISRCTNPLGHRGGHSDVLTGVEWERR